MNEMIVASSRRHPEMTVIDWNLRAKGKTGWFQPDGIHLTSDGAVSMATMVNDALVALGLASRPEGTVRQLSIAAKTLPAAHVGRRYTTRLQARGGKTPYRWARVSGVLAPGLRLASNGVVRGLPSRDGRYRFAVRVVDRVGTARTRTFVLGVAR
jgi:hypothetical protein